MFGQLVRWVCGDDDDNDGGFLFNLINSYPAYVDYGGDDDGGDDVNGMSCIMAESYT